MQTDTISKLSHTTLALHWIVGLTMIGMLALGIIMEEFDMKYLMPWHKSIGILIFAFVIARVLWRIKNGWPKPVNQYKSYEQLLSKLVHWVLIVSTVLMPLSGILMSYMGGNGLEMFGLELAGRNIDAATGEKVARNKALAGLAHSTHGIVPTVLYVAIALHVVGAFKHHIVDKDGTLKRMIGKKVDIK